MTPRCTAAYPSSSWCDQNAGLLSVRCMYVCSAAFSGSWRHWLVQCVTALCTAGQHMWGQKRCRIVVTCRHRDELNTPAPRLTTSLQDDIDVSFESIVDLSAFTVRIAQADAERLPEILLAIPQEKRQEMRAALARVWQRFTYSSYRPYAKRFRELQQQHAAVAGAAKERQQQQQQQQEQQEQQERRRQPEQLSLPATVPDLDPTADDAFGTIMAWLHSRIPHTR